MPGPRDPRPCKCVGAARMSSVPPARPAPPARHRPAAKTAELASAFRECTPSFTSFRQRDSLKGGLIPVAQEPHAAGKRFYTSFTTIRDAPNSPWSVIFVAHHSWLCSWVCAVHLLSISTRSGGVRIGRGKNCGGVRPNERKDGNVRDYKQKTC